jgi:imidazolonepropionase-like amidohydrolase
VVTVSLRACSLSALLAVGLASGCARSEAPSDGLVLHNFVLVDADAERMFLANLVIEEGKIVAIHEDAAPANESQRFTHVDGAGSFLLPAFWDLKASLWGNPSTEFFGDLYHTLWATDSLRVQLYYGVGHVVGSNTERRWMDREIRRAKALELDAAQVIYPDLPLCEPKTPDDCAVATLERLPVWLDELKQRGTPLIQIFFGKPWALMKPAPIEVLAAAIAGAHERGLRSYVLIDDWQHAQQAVELGAQAVQGLPDGEPSEALIALMKSKGVAYAPALTGWLELPRLLGNQPALQDPFLTASVQEPVLQSFMVSEDEIWEGWKPIATAEHRDRALATVARLAKAGIPIVTATDSGWASGTFQGYSMHAYQAWLERAGVDPWLRLRASAQAPAAYLGRNVGFDVGDPADFVAVRADPTREAAALREITLLVREGRVVEREALKPDVSRPEWRR